MTFKVGQEVEHIAWQIPWYLWFFVTPINVGILRVGQVYTVSAVYNHGFGRVAIDLVEAPSPQFFGVCEGWVSFMFRPVTKRKTEIFTSVPADLESERWDNRRKIGADA
jgi:hypothetical protein